MAEIIAKGRSTNSRRKSANRALRPRPWGRALGVADAGAYLGGISRTGLWRLARAGLITPRKIGGRTVFLRPDLDQYLDSLAPVGAGGERTSTTA